MIRSTTITADYSLRPRALADVLARLVEARQPVIVWGPPGCAKSQIARQVAAASQRTCLDVRVLLLDPVDLRGILWRDAGGRTRWAPPAFLPPGGAKGRWLVNLEELPSAVPMVQAALYQLMLDRRWGHRSSSARCGAGASLPWSGCAPCARSSTWRSTSARPGPNVRSTPNGWSGRWRRPSGR